MKGETLVWVVPLAVGGLLVAVAVVSYMMKPKSILKRILRI